LHISKSEQTERLNERIHNKRKQWKYNENDFAEAKLWPDYMKAYEDCFNKCNKIPWNIIPSDQNWYKEYLIAKKLLETLEHPVKAAVLVAAPIGVGTIKNYETDKAFAGGFDFNWEKIKRNAKNFIVYHSDNDPYVSLENGQELSKHLGVELTFIPNAGHFNKAAGYTKFENLLTKTI
jgi:adenosyl cobinamide kinase/adenosyl cobinamide phosphate guanylyltransferase